MKAIEPYFHAVLFIMLYKVVLIFRSVDKTLVCDHSNESYCTAVQRLLLLSCGTIYYAVQVGFKLLSLEIPEKKLDNKNNTPCLRAISITTTSQLVNLKLNRVTSS